MYPSIVFMEIQFQQIKSTDLAFFLSLQLSMLVIIFFRLCFIQRVIFFLLFSGVWNVPFISKAYLIKSSVISDIKPNPFHSEFVDSDMKFCENLRSDVSSVPFDTVLFAIMISDLAVIRFQ